MYSRKLDAKWLGKGSCLDKKKKAEEAQKKKREGAVLFF
jgi:hypothetical protein